MKRGFLIGKTLELFTITFIGTLGSYVGTVLSENNIIIIALFASIGSIIGFLGYKFFITFKFKKPTISIKQTVNFKGVFNNQNLIPFVCTVVVLLLSILFFQKAYNIASLNQLQHPRVFTWFFVLNIFGTISGMTLLTINEIKIYGFEKSLSGIVELIISRIFFTPIWGILIFMASSIALISIALIFLLLDVCGLDLFTKPEEMFDSSNLTFMFVVIQLYIMYHINEAAYTMVD